MCRDEARNRRDVRIDLLIVGHISDEKETIRGKEICAMRHVDDIRVGIEKVGREVDCPLIPVWRSRRM